MQLCSNIRTKIIFVRIICIEIIIVFLYVMIYFTETIKTDWIAFWFRDFIIINGKMILKLN